MPAALPFDRRRHSLARPGDARARDRRTATTRVCGVSACARGSARSSWRRETGARWWCCRRQHPSRTPLLRPTRQRTSDSPASCVAIPGRWVAGASSRALRTACPEGAFAAPRLARSARLGLARHCLCDFTLHSALFEADEVARFGPRETHPAFKGFLGLGTDSGKVWMTIELHRPENPRRLAHSAAPYSTARLGCSCEGLNSGWGQPTDQEAQRDGQL